MIIFNDTVSLGDSLWTFPTVAAMCIANSDDVYIHWTNKDVGELFPKKYNTKSIIDLPQTTNQIVQKISIHDIVHRGARNQEYNRAGFMSGALLAHWGFFALTNKPGYIEIEIEYPTDYSVPSYDFIISPYVLADGDRRWDEHKWQNLIFLLKGEYPNATFCVIGKSSIPCDADLLKINPYNIRDMKTNENIRLNTEKYLTGVDYYFDQPLAKVCQLLKNTRKLFLSVDSGPSNLMASIKRPHLVLYHDKNNFNQSSYSGLNSIIKNTKHISVEEVFQKSKEIIR